MNPNIQNAYEFVHPKCECHQCTWLRANSIERSMVPVYAPQSALDTCKHGIPAPFKCQECTKQDLSSGEPK